MLTSSYTIASTILLALVLILAVWFDLDRHKIPNLLTFGSAASGLAMQIAAHGTTGAFNALAGLLIGLLALMPFYLAEGMAAGDVKLMAGVGTLLGPTSCALAVGMTLLAGGVMGLATLASRGGLKAYFSRYLGMLKFLTVTGQVSYAAPQEGEAAASRFPYAIAIAAGTFGTLLWRGNW